MGRCTKVEHEKRVLEFVKLISSGWVRSALCQYAAERMGTQRPVKPTESLPRLVKPWFLILTKSVNK